MSSKDKKPARPSSSRAGGIRTLSDLNRRSGPDSDSDSDGPQEYYTGGEKSGMLVQDPSKKDDVDEIFNQARQLGAVEGPLETPSSSSASFTGTGRLLSGESVSTGPQQPEPVVHTIVFWANGFTIDDGPLRKLDDPENASFLESIRKSECPKELEPADRRAPVHVNLMRREEKCPEREKRKVSFQGVGRTLGGSSNDSSGSGSSIAPETAAVPIQTNQTGLAAPSPTPSLVIDETLPTTSIQIRLTDGTRLVGKFNLYHTVNDIRGFIDSSRPGAPVNYQLQTMGFPPTPLTDLTQTIEQAGLANSVVLQKF
ncbi:Plant UBX domain-containing protein 4 [Hirschfeldia incana]|nr:Plant UBX domain-containing protein 4 [Hirschfeldia incana]